MVLCTYPWNRTTVRVYKCSVVCERWPTITHLKFVQNHLKSYCIWITEWFFTYPIFGPSVHISPILNGKLHGLGCPHGIVLPSIHNQVVEEWLVVGEGAEAVDTHAILKEFHDFIKVTFPYDRHLFVVALELCTEQRGIRKTITRLTAVYLTW